ncbi:tRNA (5-methylaminomethyl-2-thiouridine)(34)-methyltransferase MnmD [Winogradskyella echinorum]|uniref:tRNA (5-methylaminomethyl-2-thiouridine)(34)-methyltransferase MnmD n=1 Tax=Winogradskyella echinorum TaxID=538189 RepID=A0ABR6Y3I5_9FLAO|nr:tRNA (5-methylaminomethyl-2-thiouridine)(34)-methyltransferase MnmD [Winogradskyella echinorum]MBC3847311.1 tRNA (5-methylaminomethyl-2-thiouridine)(34)-methyltransferase MnmD [Winogradskyella echinorum]MBC5751659.1 tRNA (5-methylaminomethyl-2-thiouridine)(34)-methyltransferase MnmD [Winogradskyella echinorum]
MRRKIITTSDGSKTIHIEDWDEHYHSIHGAIQEANHVFLKHGLLFYYNTFHSEKREESFLVNILEIGFGTGLNTFLTLIEAEKLNLNISYTGVEAYPVEAEEVKALNYVELISQKHATVFQDIHATSWEKEYHITSSFILEKQQKFFEDIDAEDTFNIIYFDAFGARVQPNLWTEAIFKIMYKALKKNGVLVTYSAKGSVRRAMQAVGFTVERLPGPPGKREMLRARKMCS